MGEKRFLAIKRAHEFSPNHINNDEAIFNIVVNQLIQQGLKIQICDEYEFLDHSFSADYVINMIRDKQSVRKLQLMELQGTVAVNSAFGIENCYRANLTKILLDHNIPHPKSLIVDIQNFNPDQFKLFGTGSVWVKRGDFHATQAEDVCFAPTINDVFKVFSNYLDRGITQAVVSEHLTGDLIKFYAVRGTDLFHWFYPTSQGHSKFGNEVINGEIHYHPFDELRLNQIGNRAAEALGVMIYGGDAIIDENGNIQIIDLNDWPSFAPCRVEAGNKIAECITHIVNRKKQLI